MSQPVAAVILAAGASRRLGQAKQLLTHHGETLVERAIRVAVEAGAAPVFVVLGAESAEIASKSNLAAAVVLINKQWEQGIATSIHAGLSAVEKQAPEAPGALILPCDQPRLTAHHLRSLLQASGECEALCIAASAYAGIIGTPALFPRALFPHLFSLRGDKGARALLTQPPCRVVTIDFPGGEVDIDSPDDLSQLE